MLRVDILGGLQQDVGSNIRLAKTSKRNPLIVENPKPKISLYLPILPPKIRLKGTLVFGNPPDRWKKWR